MPNVNQLIKERCDSPFLVWIDNVSSSTTSNITARTQFFQVGNETYGYRRFGGGAARPLLLLQHFTGTLDNWDPAVTDRLASGREVILFDNVGVGRSSGQVPDTIAEIAARAMAFLDGLGVARCDVLGFSLGGMVAQHIASGKAAYSTYP